MAQMRKAGDGEIWEGGQADAGRFTPAAAGR